MSSHKSREGLLPQILLVLPFLLLPSIPSDVTKDSQNTRDKELEEVAKKMEKEMENKKKNDEEVGVRMRVEQTHTSECC